jgi:hypothetical protein
MHVENSPHTVPVSGSGIEEFCRIAAPKFCGAFHTGRIVAAFNAVTGFRIPFPAPTAVLIESDKGPATARQLRNETLYSAPQVNSKTAITNGGQTITSTKSVPPIPGNPWQPLGSCLRLWARSAEALVNFFGRTLRATAPGFFLHLLSDVERKVAYSSGVSKYDG